MPKPKKKKTKPERREQRLRKAQQWVLSYTGSHIVRAYRKRFKVGVSCALNDLEAVGALSLEKLEMLKHAEEIRLQQKQKERELKRVQAFHDRFPNSDDTFYFIVGYTPGGAPYGVTWGEMGLEPYESPDDTDESF